MNITLQQLKTIMPLSLAKNREAYLAHLNAAMTEFSINTPARMAAFLAQVAHESGQLRYVQEIADGSAYEHRKDLGNLMPDALKAAHANGSTTGKFYKGHGLIQVTGYCNHRDCGKALGLDLVNTPLLLTLPEGACRSAAWFFSTSGCNELADRGAFSSITKKINGGTNGAAERLAFYGIAKKVLGVSA